MSYRRLKITSNSPYLYPTLAPIPQDYREIGEEWITVVFVRNSGFSLWEVALSDGK